MNNIFVKEVINKVVSFRTFEKTFLSQKELSNTISPPSTPKITFWTQFDTSSFYKTSVEYKRYPVTNNKSTITLSLSFVKRS